MLKQAEALEDMIFAEFGMSLINWPMTPTFAIWPKVDESSSRANKLSVTQASRVTWDLRSLRACVNEGANFRNSAPEGNSRSKARARIRLKIIIKKMSLSVCFYLVQVKSWKITQQWPYRSSTFRSSHSVFVEVSLCCIWSIRWLSDEVSKRRMSGKLAWYSASSSAVPTAPAAAPVSPELVGLFLRRPSVELLYADAGRPSCLEAGREGVLKLFAFNCSLLGCTSSSLPRIVWSRWGRRFTISALSRSPTTMYPFCRASIAASLTSVCLSSPANFIRVGINFDKPIWLAWKIDWRSMYWNQSTAQYKKQIKTSQNWFL